LLGRRGWDRHIHGIEAIARIFGVGSGGVLENNLAVGRDGLIVVGLFQLGLGGFGELHRPDELCFGLVGVAESDQDFVHMAVLGIGLDDGLIMGYRCRPVVGVRGVKRGD